MSDDSPWTVLRLLEWTTGYLRDRGSQSPRLDAEVLLAHCRQSSRIELYTAYEEIVTDGVRGQFRQLIQRRAEGCPVAYLVGSREFFSRSFDVSPAVLIPRPESEFVITTLVDRAKQSRLGQTAIFVADVGTGSGILAITCCLELRGCRAVATDVSQDALAVAQSNARRHKVADRIEFKQTNLLDNVAADRRFDFVISNPPYVSEAEYRDLPADVKDFEPSGALVAGPDGTQIIRRLIPQAARRLKPGGWLILEISPMIERDVAQGLTTHGGWGRVASVEDLAKAPRVIAAQWTGNAT